MPAYYNEIDPQAAQWLRELMNNNLIAPGYVDERSIEDVKPQDLSQYTQCHFFAGIGVWSYALRAAGWSDNRPVWTGSCPCQPFSSAGKGNGFDDERHLWPAFHWLIQQYKPLVIFGEQVASKAIDPWIDLIQADLEALDYAFGGVPFPAAGVGAPHIRDRLYWVGDSQSKQSLRESSQILRCKSEVGGSGLSSSLADSNRAGLEGFWRSEQESNSQGRQGPKRHSTQDSRLSPSGYSSQNQSFWGNADWLRCRDGKFRPVEPSTFPLAPRAPSRVGLLRGYGNAINAEAAKVWIECYLES